MPAWVARRRAAALCGYLCVAVLYTWPLALHLRDSLPGPISGDTGVYVWNLWVFRHEIVVHHRFPFLTDEILSLTAPAPLTLHNYTTFANLLAFPLLPILGTVATFNVLMIASIVLSAYAMFLLASARVHDDAGAWLAGLLFGFSPFMSARVAEHFSLVQAAPLPLFVLVLYRLESKPTARTAAAAGLIVAWAFLCDPYYAVYCLLIATMVAIHSTVAVEHRPREWVGWRFAPLDLALLCVAGLVAGIIIRGGGRADIFGLRVSMRRLYTPVMVLTVLVLVRAWLTLRLRLSWIGREKMPSFRAICFAFVVCGVILAPVLYATSAAFWQRNWISPHVYWRSSAPGMDLLALFAPNPMNPVLRALSADWLEHLPNGFIENVATIPWTAVATIAAAVLLRRFRPPAYWVLFTAVFGLLTLGPFIRVAGTPTYVPTPWALLRYVPVIGAARMPGRMTVLLMLGVAMLLAYGVAHLRAAAPKWRTPVVVSALLLLELFPGPKRLYSARVPDVYRVIAADPRPVRVVTLPIGMRDGLSSFGDYSAAMQFYQTVHEKPIVGGYLSRLPRRSANRYRRMGVIRVMIELSEGKNVPPDRLEAAIRRAHERRARYNIGYVVFERSRVSEALRNFAVAAFDLEYVTSDGDFELYRVPES